MPRQSFATLFEAHQGRPSAKWEHYFPAYDREFAAFRGRTTRMLEIGVARGGSVQMFRRFLGARSVVVGIDINPRCKAYEERGVRIEIGSQSDPEFLARIVEEHGPFDIILDDGSHMMGDQITSLEHLYKAVKPGGVYAVEDIHTSYFTRFGGGYRRPDSFVEHAKGKIDAQNMWWSHRMPQEAVEDWTPWLSRITFYPGMVFFHRDPVNSPRPVYSEEGATRADPGRHLAWGKADDPTG
ncbi:MAG: class I SAM-dependent methyltransferase [Sulfitobacter sp.]|nr:class I SAM-dependent methyltransferase [Sulfitobacter sp.]